MEPTSSNKKFEEALQLLNEAAKEKKEEIQHLLKEKYTDISQTLQDLASEKVTDLKHVRRLAEKAVGQGQEKAKEVAGDVDKKVRENPWPFLAGTAVAALFLGFIMGNSKKD